MRRRTRASAPGLPLVAFAFALLLSIGVVCAPASAAEDPDTADERQVTILVTIDPLDPCVAGQSGCGTVVDVSGGGGLAITGTASMDVLLGVAIILIAVGVAVYGRFGTQRRSEAAVRGRSAEPDGA